jgi:hypothetical protein
MTGRRTIALKAALLALSIGCAAPIESSPEEEQIEEAATTLINGNSLVPNALVPNALVPNALVPNALVPNALSPSALSPSALAAIQDSGTGGMLSRLFMKYAVGCAFTPTQAFSFSWTDTQNVIHQEVYYGLLGVAPDWSAKPLSRDGQEIVSACIAGRTNYYGAQVTISMRSVQSPLKTLADSPELSAYPYVEGGFWGNLFATSPRLSACYTTANVAHSRAAWRECATGHADTDGTVACGIIQLLGPCESRCQSLNGAGQYYPSCTDPVWGSTKNVVTSALP